MTQLSLIPLRLGASSPAWVADMPTEASAAPCSFCGLGASSFQLRQGGTTACPLCRAALTLNRPRIDEEFVLIWLPEVPQAAVMHVARSCHLIFHVHGEEPHMTRRPRVDTAYLRAAYRSFHALLSLIPDVDAPIGTTSPRDVWAALAGMPPEKRPRAEQSLAGARLLPLGHFFQDGRDIYPDILDSWAAQGGPLSALPH